MPVVKLNKRARQPSENMRELEPASLETGKVDALGFKPKDKPLTHAGGLSWGLDPKNETEVMKKGGKNDEDCSGA
jgi:hypothetical protein